MADRSRRVAQLLLLVAALGLWGASRLTWVSIIVADGLGQPRDIDVNGAAWSAALTPLALVLAAVAVAALAAKPWALRLLAAVVAAAVAALGYLGVSQWVVADVARRAAGIVDVATNTLAGSSRHYSGAVLTLICAGCALAAAVLLLRAASSSGTTAAARYAAPAVRRGDSARTAGAGAAMSNG